MTDHPSQATLFRLAAERLGGKPFTVSEYNHPAPLDAQAECVPMIASFAAAQDWDGIWLFTYSHATDNWAREAMSGFFDIDANPAKWGFMRAGTAIFREQAMAPLETIKIVQVAEIPAELADPGRIPSQARLQHAERTDRCRRRHLRGYAPRPDRSRATATPIRRTRGGAGSTELGGPWTQRARASIRSSVRRPRSTPDTQADLRRRRRARFGSSLRSSSP